MPKDKRAKPTETIERTRLAMKLTEMAIAETRRTIEDSRRLIMQSREMATAACPVPRRSITANDNERLAGAKPVP